MTSGKGTECVAVKINIKLVWQDADSPFRQRFCAGSLNDAPMCIGVTCPSTHISSCLPSWTASETSLVRAHGHTSHTADTHTRQDLALGEPVAPERVSS